MFISDALLRCSLCVTRAPPGPGKLGPYDMPAETHSPPHHCGQPALPHMIAPKGRAKSNLPWPSTITPKQRGAGLPYLSTRRSPYIYGLGNFPGGHTSREAKGTRKLHPQDPPYTTHPPSISYIIANHAAAIHSSSVAQRPAPSS